jgi:outer membrane protein TolC
VSLSQENFRLSQVKYEGGEGLALDVVAAQSQLAQALGNYYSAIAAYFNARADFEVASGK